jgi:dipeptidase E
MGASLELGSLPFVPSRPPPGPIVVVPTAANPLPDRDRIVGDLVAALAGPGREIRVVDPETEGIAGLGGAGTIAVGGGDPFHLLDVLRRTGADQVLTDAFVQGAPYIGISAGAMVAAPSLAPVVGLGLTTTLVLPHDDRPGRAASHVATLSNHRLAGPLVPLLDDEVLLERDGSSTVHWPAGRSLRAGTAADGAGVADVFGAAARSAWVTFLGDAVSSFAPTAADWAPRIEGAAGSGTFPVVELDGRIVAFAATRAPADDDLADAAGVGELHLFYASPSVWGTDTARRLHRRALWDLAAAGRTSAVLWTEDRNDRALRFYARAGWRPEGAHRERTFLSVPITESRHRIDLAPALAAP